MPSRHMQNPGLLLKARSVLLAAHDLLRDPSRWTQGTVARDQTGETVDVTDPRAQKWCAVGAITRAAHDMSLPEYEQHTVQTLAQELMMLDLKAWEGTNSIPNANDKIGGYATIMAAFRRLLDHRRFQTLSRRSEAAMKGWETRRRIRAEHNARVAAEVAARRAAWEARRAASQPMTFGGTLPVSSINADAKKEITV